MILGIDIETCSAADINDGAAPYAEHETTRVWCVVFGFADSKNDDVRVHRWRPGMALPVDVRAHITSGLPVLAHNAGFEDSIWHSILSPTLGWPEIAVEQWLDSALLASAVALPIALGALGPVIGAEVVKDDEGHKLMLSLAKVTKDKATGEWVYPKPTPAELLRLTDYCETDVLSMFACYWRLPRPTPDEARLMVVDRRVNRRGVTLDLTLARAISAAAAKRKTDIFIDAFEESGGLFGVGSPAALKDWLRDQGVAIPKVPKRVNGVYTSVESLDKAGIKILSERTDLPDHVRTVLGLRGEQSRATSIAKAARAIDVICRDNRLRYALRFSHAHTGRWSSEAMQLHNLAKPSKAFKSKAVDFARAILTGDNERASKLHPLMEGLSFVLRMLVCAATGKELIGADFSAIEARVVAWVAGQVDVVETFASGADIYVKDAAAVGSDNRDFGKVQRLGLGFSMGAVRFIEQAAKAGILLTPKRAREVVNGWRENNPKIVQFWKDIEDAFRQAILEPSVPILVGEHITVIGSKSCVRIVLPSGRALHYWRPRIKHVTKRIEVVSPEGVIEWREFETDEIQFFRPKGGVMTAEATYSGKLTENLVQAIARDLLGAALLRLEDTDYKTVIHVHDAITAEVPEGFGSVDEYCKLMSETPPWAPGLPVAAEGYRSTFFKG